MNETQQVAVGAYTITNLIIFCKGLYESKYRKNPFGLTSYLLPLGIFVWGDAVVIGAFWVLVGIISFWMQSWYLFLLLISLFWVVRSLGEVIYWLSQQFSSKDRNPPKTLTGWQIFPNDSIWFAYQVKWQCIMVLALVSSIYWAHQWIKTLG